MPKNTTREKKPASKATKRHNLHNVHEANGFLPHFSSRRGKHKEMSLPNINPSVALGVIAMGVAGAATFMMLNSKKHTRKLRGNLYNKYQDIKDEAGEYAHEAMEKGRKIYDSASEYAEGIRDAAQEAFEQPHSGSLLLAGALGGTLLGATSVYFLNRYQGSGHSHEFLDKLMDIFGSVKNAATSMTGNRNSHGWLDTAKQFMESIQESMGHDQDEEEEELTHNLPRSSILRDAIHLGFVGLRLWDNMMHSRR